MKAPSGDCLPAHGTAKVTQIVVLNNPNKVGLKSLWLQAQSQTFTNEQEHYYRKQFLSFSYISAMLTLLLKPVIMILNLAGQKESSVSKSFLPSGEPEDEDPLILHQARLSLSGHSPD